MWNVPWKLIWKNLFDNTKWGALTETLHVPVMSSVPACSSLCLWGTLVCMSGRWLRGADQWYLRQTKFLLFAFGFYFLLNISSLFKDLLTVGKPNLCSLTINYFISLVNCHFVFAFLFNSWFWSIRTDNSYNCQKEILHWHPILVTVFYLTINIMVTHIILLKNCDKGMICHSWVD